MAEAVPGLAAWLQELKLGSRAAAIAKWAEEQGAIDLEELVENHEDLANDLNLKPLERKRLADGAEAAAKKVLGSKAAPPSAVQAEPQDEEEEEAAGQDEFNEARLAQLELVGDFAELSTCDRGGSSAPGPPARAAAKPKTITAHGPAQAADKDTMARDLQKMIAICMPNSEFAPKLAEMILELGEEEVQACLDSEEKLAERLEEGLGLLDDDSQLEEGLAVFDAASEPAKVKRSEGQTGSGAGAAQERRIDPEDGQARTLREMRAFYVGQFTHQEIDEHWQSCEPVKPGAAAQTHAERSSAAVSRSSGAPVSRGNTGAVASGKQTRQTPEAPDPARKRIDPADGVARTFAELEAACADQYAAQEIKDYWATMTPVGYTGKGKPSKGRSGYAPAAALPISDPPRATQGARSAGATAALPAVPQAGAAKAAQGTPWGAGRGKRRF